MIAAISMTQPKARIRTPRNRPGVRASVFIGADGRSHTFLNCAFPTTPDGAMAAPLEASICSVCGHGYAYLMLTGVDTCAECRIEIAAEAAREYEEAGIYLGWSWRRKGDEVQEIEPIYGREQYLRRTQWSLLPSDAECA